MQKKNFKEIMSCHKCGKIIALKGNRKYCKKCSQINIRELNKKWRLNNPQKIKESKRKDYLKHKDYINKKNSEWYYKKKGELGFSPNKLLAEQRRFGRERKEILERDNYTCQRCGSKKLICIHHIDKTGRSVQNNHNNKLENLITLCRKCHINIHRKELLEGKGII